MLVRVRNIMGCYSEAPSYKYVDVNPKAIAWVEFLGIQFDQGPFFCIKFIGNSDITVDANDHAKIMAEWQPINTDPGTH